MEILQESTKMPVIFNCPNCGCKCREVFFRVKVIKKKVHQKDGDVCKTPDKIYYQANCPQCKALMEKSIEDYEKQPKQLDITPSGDKLDKPYLSNDEAERICAWYSEYRRNQSIVSEETDEIDTIAECQARSDWHLITKIKELFMQGN